MLAMRAPLDLIWFWEAVEEGLNEDIDKHYLQEQSISMAEQEEKDALWKVPVCLHWLKKNKG